MEHLNTNLSETSRSFVVGLLGVWIVFGTVGVLAAQEESGDLILSAKWSPPCSMTDVQPYFGIDVLTDGTVRYFGGDEAREIGERRAQISKRQLRQLVRAMRRAESGTTVAAGRPAEDESPEYCLEITKQGNRVTRAGGEDAHVQDFMAVFDELIREHHWVCPARAPKADPRRPLQSSLICGGYMQRPAVVFSLFNEGECFGFGGAVYSDLIYYSNARRIVTPGAAYQPIEPASGDGYLPIEPAQFKAIVDAARTFPLSKSGIEEPNPRPDQDYGTYQESLNRPSKRFQSDLQHLRSVLKEVFKSAYPQSSSVSDCRGAPISGGLTLRYENGPPLDQ